MGTYTTNFNLYNPVQGETGWGSPSGVKQVNQNWANIDSLCAPLASPHFPNIPTAPTAVPGTSTSQIASTEFVIIAVGSISGSVLLNPSTDQTINGLYK